MTKFSATKGEVMEYLEGVILSGYADEVEEKVYEDVKWKGKCKRSEYNHVLSNMEYEWSLEFPRTTTYELVN